MLPIKNPMHPVHLVNYYHSILKSVLREMRPIKRKYCLVPELTQSVSYYFTFATQPRREFNQMFWALTCFAYDGEIVFQSKGAFDVSLWHFERQGLSRTAQRIEGTIKNCFRRNNVPLNPTTPFQKVADNLYWINISWGSYFKLKEL